MPALPPCSHASRYDDPATGYPHCPRCHSTTTRKRYRRWYWRTHIRQRRPHLTHRQQDVMALVAEGLTNQAIAARLGLTRAAVAKRTRNIYSAMGIEDQPGLDCRVAAVRLWLGGRLRKALG